MKNGTPVKLSPEPTRRHGIRPSDSGARREYAEHTRALPLPLPLQLKLRHTIVQGAGRADLHDKTAQISSRVLFGALLLVLAMSPFEAGYPPLGRFLWATFTNLEAALFVLLGAWMCAMAVDPQTRKRFLRLPLLAPITALLVASVVSTALGEYKALGVQFIYRLLMGVLVYACAWLTLNSRLRVLAAAGTFVGAGFVSAVLGLLEFASWVNVEPWLSAFKPQPTTVGGMLRLSGTFEYANGAAMYFEMALPMLLGLLLFFSAKGAVASAPQDHPKNRGAKSLTSKLPIAALYAMAGLYAMALILTFSRAAWAGTLVAVAVLFVALILRRRSQTKESLAASAGLPGAPAPNENVRAAPHAFAPIRVLALAVAVMAVGAVYVSLTQPLLWLRLTGENDRSWYRNTISPGQVPALSAGSIVTVPVTLRNDGPMTWWAERVPLVHLSYHWMSADKSHYVLFEGERTKLPHDVYPGQSVTVEAVLMAPPKPGEYYLQWDLVQENVTWFSEKAGVSTEPTRHVISEDTTLSGRLRRPPAVNHPPISVRDFANRDTSTVPRSKLWRTAFAMFQDHPLFGVGPDGFRNLYGKYAGVSDWNRNIYTNNTYIEMFTNLGLAGGLAFLWLAGLALWSAVRIVLGKGQGAHGLWLLKLGAAASLIAFFFHGMVDYFLFSTPIYVIFWFIMAVAGSRQAEAEAET